MSDQDSIDVPAGAKDAGEFGEAVTASLISEVMGGDLVFQHSPGEAPQGIDIAYTNDGQLHVAEVKSIIGDWHESHTANTVNGRQMDSEWVADRLDRIGLETTLDQIGDGPDQVGTELYQVDFPGETIARYELDSNGFRTEATPQEIYSLSDVLEIHSANQELEIEPFDIINEETVESGENEETEGESA